MLKFQNYLLNSAEILNTHPLNTVHNAYKRIGECAAEMVTYATGSAKIRHNCTYFKFHFIKYLQVYANFSL